MRDEHYTVRDALDEVAVHILAIRRSVGPAMTIDDARMCATKLQTQIEILKMVKEILTGDTDRDAPF